MLEDVEGGLTGMSNGLFETLQEFMKAELKVYIIRLKVKVQKK